LNFRRSCLFFVHLVDGKTLNLALFSRERTKDAAMNKFVYLLLLLLLILHQDFWLWDNAQLVLGFMPAGLAYHAAYSIVAALTWAWIIKVAWPSHLEAWADAPEEGEGDAE
jgi:hypothetical protein